MEYSKRLINEAKRVYPGWKKLHELFEKGSMMVLTLLNENQPNGTIPIATVLNAETIEELHELANIELERAEFYLEVIAFVEDYRKNRNAQRLQEIQEAHARGERLT